MHDTTLNQKSNGEDVARQILRIYHHKCAALLLQGHLDTLDEQCHLQALGDSGLDDEDHDHINLDGHFKLGSPQSHADTIQDIENRLGAQDLAFQDFHKKLANFINMSLPTYGYQLTRWTIIPTDFQICEYRYLKLNYESTVNWRQSTDHLQSNPSFHGSPCFDCALIQLTAERTVFVKIIFMFKCKVLDIGAFQFALVQPYTTGIPGGSHRINQDLRLTQAKAVPRKDLIFVPLKSFIQEAVLACDPEHQDEFLVVEHIDSMGTLMSLSDMVKIYFIGHQGPYLTYILPSSSKPTPPPTTNLFLPPPVTLALVSMPSYGHHYPLPPKPNFPPPNSSYIRFKDMVKKDFAATLVPMPITILHLQNPLSLHQILPTLEREVNVNPVTLREFEDMVKKDFIGQGPYSTYILPSFSKATPPPTTNPSLLPPAALALTPITIIHLQNPLSLHQILPTLKWVVNMDLVTLREFEDMVKKDFADSTTLIVETELSHYKQHLQLVTVSFKEMSDRNSDSGSDFEAELDAAVETAQQAYNILQVEF
ncbi:hypothetical protein BDR06DRAFT_977438 [Suillus hirtellus]|nr:hypothetical protein BDR06DRAFT_977438 [Suillus hirtellus]